MNPHYNFKTIDGYTFRYIVDYSASEDDPLVGIVLDGEHHPGGAAFRDALREAHNALFDLRHMAIYARLANQIGYNRSLIDDWKIERIQVVSAHIETLLKEKYWSVPHELKPVFQNTLDILLAAIRQRVNAPKLQYVLPPSNCNPGYVYLLQSPTSAYKIGRTSNPDNRLKTFNVKLPFEVDYICIIKTADMVGLEQQLHSKFADRRINGEWFALEPEDIAFIKGLST